jgi:hypothetical protein
VKAVVCGVILWLKENMKRNGWLKKCKLCRKYVWHGNDSVSWLKMKAKG